MKMCVFFPWSFVARSALESLLTRARALGLAAHLTDRFYDIDVTADLSQLANELQRLPKKAPRTAYGAEEPLKNPPLMLSLEYGPVYLWLAYYCWAARRTKLSPGPQEVGLSTTGMQRYLPNEHSRCSRGVGLERKISMTSQGKCATYFSV
jgi:hypothetical protein